MRIIDGDALYKALTDEACHKILQSDGSPFDVGRTNGIIFARDIIRTQPTIEPKRGHWSGSRFYERFENSYEEQCSACGSWSLEQGNFCPSCGACMSGADMGKEGEG